MTQRHKRMILSKFYLYGHKKLPINFNLGLTRDMTGCRTNGPQKGELNIVFYCAIVVEKDKTITY